MNLNQLQRLITCLFLNMEVHGFQSPSIGLESPTTTLHSDFQVQGGARGDHLLDPLAAKE